MAPLERRDENGLSFRLKGENQRHVFVVRCAAFDPVLPVASLYILLGRHKNHTGMANRKHVFHRQSVTGKLLFEVPGVDDQAVIQTQIQPSFRLIFGERRIFHPVGRIPTLKAGYKGILAGCA